MKLEEFQESANHGSSPPESLSKPLKALWMDRQGNWEEAHRLCQEAKSADGDWVHAYLHRKEGDLSNAAYWYQRAQKPVEEGGLEEEWAAIVTTLLKLRD